MTAKKTEKTSEKLNIKLNIIEPRATEKTYLEQAKRTYVFEVKKSASKQAVKALVEKDHNVTVEDVRILLRKGKKTKFSKGKHAYPGTTYRRDRKYAYVTLKDGDSIKVFEMPEQGSDKTQSAGSSSEKKTKKLSAKAPKKGEKNA
ncbi:50S ribosomal protein L23 [Candidatus Saccharibacteria bacterium]|nr:50S ribosomal protein L23 [Candidatus Saccharibacteria bacterium]